VSAWPNLFVVGAAKAATTSLSQYLASHPDIHMSPVKEPHYFSCANVPGLPKVTEEGAYLRLFSRANGASYRGEASVSYLWDERSAAAIHTASPDARIVISLREQVDRAYSHYWTYVRLGLEPRSFRTAVAEELEHEPDLAATPPPYIARGRYPDQIQRYFDLFGDRVLVVFFDDIAADVQGTMRRIFEFLDVEPAAADAIDPVVHHPFGIPRNAAARRVIRSARARTLGRVVVPRSLRARVERMLAETAKPPLDADIREKLRGLYAADNDRLRAMLSRPLPWDTR
jgi:hypothetical protein